MPKPITIHEAKTNLSKYIKQAKSGKEVYIGSYGRPEVKMVSVGKQGKVKFGFWGKLDFKDEDFVGTNPDIQEMFYGAGWGKK